MHQTTFFTQLVLVFLVLTQAQTNVTTNETATIPSSPDSTASVMCSQVTDCGGCVAANPQCVWCSTNSMCFDTNSVSDVQSCAAVYTDSCPDVVHSFYDKNKTVIIIVSVAAAVVVALAICIAIYCCCRKKIHKRRRNWVAQQNLEKEDEDAIRHEHHIERKEQNKLKYDKIRKKYNIMAKDGSASSIKV